MLDYFFKMRNEIPAEVEGFRQFDLTHFSWLAGCVVLAVLLCLVYRAMGAKGRRITAVLFGLALLGFNTLRAVTLIAKGEYDIGCLPLHLCGMSVYLEAIDCYIPNRLTRELSFAVCMPGAAMALLCPEWTAYPVLNFMHISCSMLHVLLTVYPIMLLAGGELRPSVRRLPMCVGFLAAVSLPIFFLNRLWGTNYMFLSRPAAGSPLVWFESWLGTPGYLVGFPIIAAVLWTMLYLPFLLADRARRRRSLGADCSDKAQGINS